MAERIQLITLRKAKNMTQAEAAKAVDISASQYQMIENGERNPSLMVAFKIAQLFGVSVEALFCTFESHT